MDDFVSLRELRENDAEQLSFLANNVNIAVNLRDRFPNPYTLDDAIRFLEMMKKEQTLINFAVCLNGEFVGMVGLIPQEDIYRFNAEMGYWIAEHYWNRGIASKAVSLILEYAKHYSPFIRIYANVFENNIGSQKVLIKNGFTFEGKAQNAVFKLNRFFDEYRYSYVFEDKINENAL